LEIRDDYKFLFFVMMSIFIISFLTQIVPFTCQCEGERCAEEWSRCEGVTMPELYYCLRSEASVCCEEFLESWNVGECADDNDNCVKWREDNMVCQQADSNLLSTILNLCPYSCGLCLEPTRSPTSLWGSGTRSPSVPPDSTPRTNLANEALVPVDTAIVATLMFLVSLIICCMANGFLRDPCGCGPSCDCFGNYSPPLRPVIAPIGLRRGQLPDTAFTQVDPNEAGGGCLCLSNTQAPEPRGRKITLPRKSNRRDASDINSHETMPFRAQNNIIQRGYRVQ